MLGLDALQTDRRVRAFGGIALDDGSRFPPRRMEIYLKIIYKLFILQKPLPKREKWRKFVGLKWRQWKIELPLNTINQSSFTRNSLIFQNRFRAETKLGKFSCNGQLKKMPQPSSPVSLGPKAPARKSLAIAGTGIETAINIGLIKMAE